MCGRFALSQTPRDVKEWFDYDDVPNFPPRYNIAPTQPVPVVHFERGMRRFTLMRWGFIPSFVKDVAAWPLMINIRSETAADKPSFRSALRYRRAVVPADAFYEWRRIGREREPFMIRRPDRGLFAIAALYETWLGADGSEIDTVGLLTTHANATMAAIHERSPVLIARRDLPAWFDPAARPDELAPLLRPPADEETELVRIGPAVNKVANDDVSIQEPAGDTPLPRLPEQPSLF